MRKQGKETGTNSPKRIGRVVLIAALVAVFALGAMAAISLRTSQAKNSNPSAKSERLKANTHSTVGLRSVAQQMPVDPQTGMIRPLTQEEAEGMAEALKRLANQSTEGLKSVKHADGSVSIDLQDRFQNVVLAKKTEDGRVAQACVDNPEAGAAFLGIDPQLVGATPGGAAPRLAPLAPAKGRDQ